MDCNLAEDCNVITKVIEVKSLTIAEEGGFMTISLIILLSNCDFFWIARGQW